MLHLRYEAGIARKLILTKKVYHSFPVMFAVNIIENSCPYNGKDENLTCLPASHIIRRYAG